MRQTRPLYLSLAVAGALVATLGSGLGHAADAGAARAYSVAQSRITVAGTSNLHEWSVSADALHATLALPGGFLDGAGGTPTGTFSLATSALKSDKDRMNKLMWEALKAEQHPTLQFDLKSVRWKGAPPAAPGSAAPIALEGEGVLELAGVSRPVTVPLTLRRDGERLIVRGELPVEMTDYGISPPTAMLGALKTGNKVVITIDATLVPGHA